MRILHLLNTGSFSGAENVVCQIIKLFENDNAFEMVYSSMDGDMTLILQEKKIKFFPFPKLTLFGLKKIIRKYKPDVIHAHDRAASCIAALAAPFDIKIVSHIHGKFEDMSHITIKSILYEMATLRISHIFWVSKSAFGEYYFKKRIIQKSSVLYNVVDKFELYNKCYKDKNIYNYDIIFLGRLTYPKNPQRLIRVLEKVKKRKEDIKIAVVGTGNLEEDTKKMVCDLRMEKNLDFYGFLQNPFKILKSSKVMIMTSRTEGTPMSVLEAMALGVPLVSTPADGICELIENGRNGFLSDEDEVLAEKLLEIIERPFMREEMSSYTIEKFESISDMAKYKAQLEEIYYKKD